MAFNERKFPQHIVDMAVAWTQGVDVRPMLYDALVDMGIDRVDDGLWQPFVEEHLLGLKDGEPYCFACVPPHKCDVVDAILEDAGRYFDFTKDVKGNTIYAVGGENQNQPALG